jgi:hypothetical protein
MQEITDGENRLRRISSDYEKLKVLLDDFGVKYSESIEKSCTKYPTNEILAENAKLIEVEYDGECEKVTGYMGFSTVFYFTNEGKFIQMGAWE